VVTVKVAAVTATSQVNRFEMMRGRDLAIQQVCMVVKHGQGLAAKPAN